MAALVVLALCPAAASSDGGCLGPWRTAGGHAWCVAAAAGGGQAPAEARATSAEGLHYRVHCLRGPLEGLELQVTGDSPRSAARRRDLACQSRSRLRGVTYPAEALNVLTR